MNTYTITFNNGLKRTIYADSHLVIETGNGINCDWFIRDNQVICMVVDVKSIDKE